MKCDGTHAETIFSLSAKRTSPFKSAGASVQSTTGSRGVRISGSNAGFTVFRGSVKSTGYPLHSPVSPSLPRSCVTVCHDISTEVYQLRAGQGKETAREFATVMESGGKAATLERGRFSLASYAVQRSREGNREAPIHRSVSYN